MKLFSGLSHQALAEEVAALIRVPLGNVRLGRFRSGEIYVNFEESVRGKDVYILQSFSPPINEHFMELLVMVDALKRSSVGTINAIIPYYGYARQEKQDKPREPITAKMIADMLTTIGVQRVITFDLHAPAIQGFFNIPVEHLTALDVLAEAVRTLRLENAVVVSPDAGRVKTAEKFANLLDLPFAIVHKRRPGHHEAAVTHIIGDVKGKTPIIIEDMIDTGGTILKVVERLMENGAKPAIVCATHAVFSPPAQEKLNHPGIEKMIVTNTLPIEERSFERLQIVSVAPLLAEAISRIHEHRSISIIWQESDSVKE
ncbi:ribose-phosphate pyrophosphokinase [Fodinisporobacter ferrooxydans]|uniref:Ribose-phosphate pyrophosphokinase n=2 Tax=Fodinisporobacter ferrooxydans TaxID=2901836 RepID=A0ABY4CQJ0_9BACL|nr:ribose-phosphate pyrophosphokinase [Alicyclobacillaceae bacterium MYW30-H2]